MSAGEAWTKNYRHQIFNVRNVVERFIAYLRQSDREILERCK
jgi:hypothetical protein